MDNENVQEETRDKLITVIIPFINEKSDIERSVNSIVSQRDTSAYYEIVILNGCGVQSEDRLKRIEGKMPEAVLLIMAGDNSSKSELLNLGIEYASGKYIAFLKAGDEYNRRLFHNIEILSAVADPDMISYGMTKAHESFEYFEYEPFDEYSYKIVDLAASWQRKEFLSGDETNERYLCNAYNLDFLRSVGQRFGEDTEEDDDITFVYPIYFFINKIAVTKDHGYCSYFDYKYVRDQENVRERISSRLNLQLQLFELLQSITEIYNEYRDVIEAHFFYEYFLKNLELVESNGKNDSLSDEILQIIRFVTFKIIPKWNENDYICALSKERIERTQYLAADGGSSEELCSKLSQIGKVSVIIATRNRCEYLRRAIECILMQTWKNSELIIIDDGSEDDTTKIVNEYKDDRIVYIRNDCNKGISYARNEGLKAASGKYIVYQDDDDLCRLDKIEKQVIFMENHPHNVGMSYCVTINHCNALRGNPFAPVVLIPANKENSYMGCSGFIFPKLLPKNFVACTAMIIRRECFEEVGTFDESLFAYEDWDITLRIAKRYEIGIVKEILYDYYQRNNGLASNKDPEHRRGVIRALYAIDIKYKGDMKKYGIASKFVLKEQIGIQ